MVQGIKVNIGHLQFIEEYPKGTVGAISFTRFDGTTVEVGILIFNIDPEIAEAQSVPAIGKKNILVMSFQRYIIAEEYLLFGLRSGAVDSQVIEAHIDAADPHWYIGRAALVE
jgi:hypothetical protein